jgi:hypothetical protein
MIKEGDWERDKLHGIGRMVFQDGSIYRGEVSHGEINGSGK